MCVLGRKLRDHFIWLGDHRLQEKGHLSSSKCSAMTKARRCAGQRQKGDMRCICRLVGVLEMAKNAQLVRLLGIIRLIPALAGM